MAASDLWTLYDPNGNAYALDGSSGITLGWGLSGADMPVFAARRDPLPREGGTRLRQVLVQSRELQLPVTLQAASAAALRTLSRGLEAAFLPGLYGAPRSCRLRVVSPLNDTREITCVYDHGFEGARERGSSVPWARASLTFIADDPYFYAVTPVSATYTLGAPQATFFPFFPLRLSTSSVIADATVTNSGDVPAWPVWTITGPGDGLTLRNVTSGELLSFGQTLTSVDTLVIDTRPGYKTVTLNGANAFGLLSTDSSLWALGAGTTRLWVELGNATSLTSANLTFYPRFAGS